MEAECRSPGLVPEPSCAHFAPSQVQVSARGLNGYVVPDTCAVVLEAARNTSGEPP